MDLVNNEVGCDWKYKSKGFVNFQSLFGVEGTVVSANYWGFLVRGNLILVNWLTLMDTETGDNILTAHIQSETNKPPLLAAVSVVV